MTFENYLTTFHTKQTIASYLHLTDRFLLDFPNPEKAKYNAILKYFEKMKTHPITALSAVKKYYDYLVEIEKIKEHPCKHLTIRIKNKPIQHQDFFKRNELERLLDRPCRYSILENRNKSIISLLIYQGLTSENLVRLRLTDIQFSEGTVYIKASTKARRRLLELEARQIVFLLNYIENDRPKLLKTPSNQLFVGMKGEALTVDGLFRMIKPMNSLYPDRILNPLTIRQSVVRHLTHEKNLPLEKVQEISGHKWLSTIEKYKSNDMVEQRRLINEFHPMNRM